MVELDSRASCRNLLARSVHDIVSLMDVCREPELLGDLPCLLTPAEEPSVSHLQATVRRTLRRIGCDGSKRRWRPGSLCPQTRSDPDRHLLPPAARGGRRPEQSIRLQSSMASRAHSMSRRMAIPWSRCWSNPAALILLRSTNGVAPNRSLSARRLSHSQSAAISLRFPRFASASANLTASARYRRMTTASLFRRGDGRALPVLLDPVSL